MCLSVYDKVLLRLPLSLPQSTYPRSKPDYNPKPKPYTAITPTRTPNPITPIFNLNPYPKTVKQWS